MYRNFFSLLPRKSIVSASAAGLVMLTLAGCGIGSSAVSTTQSVVMPSISGRVMGGETPVAGANIILWETDPAATNYGSAGKQLGTATGSTPGGSFTFTTGYTCDAGQFVYLTSTGGDVSNGSASPIINNNLVMIAALGSCSNFNNATAQAKVNLVVNELSTVAAAYALGSFITVNQNGGTGNQLVSIGAPPNNNAATGSCTGTGTSMSCTSAGLAHAFANAANLVDAVHYDNSAPTGSAFTTVPGNTLGSVPQALINSLGNIIGYCTNSAGGVAGDSSNCGTLFTDATSPSGSVPADTLSALLNIAKAPYNNVGTSCVGATGGLFCLLGTFNAFNPVLTGVPHDWSIGIAYTGASALASPNIGQPQYVVLDANDNVYVMSSNSYTATQNGVMALTSAGSGIWSIAPTTNFCASGAMATDLTGNIWLSIPAATSASAGCSYAVYGLSAASGTQTFELAPGSGTVCGLSGAGLNSTTCPGFPAGGYDTTHAVQSTPYTIAFDRFNNLWYGRSSSSCTNCILQMPYNSGTTNYGAGTNSQNTTPTLNNQMIVDSNANVWVSNSTGSGTARLYEVYNTGTAAAPTYTASAGFAQVTLAGVKNGGIGIDSVGNIWTGYASNTAEYTPSGTGATSAFGSPTARTTAASQPYVGEVDGGSIYWYGSLSTSLTTGGLFAQYTPNAGLYSSTTAANNTRQIRPCYLLNGGTTCDTALFNVSQFQAMGDAKAVQVDSTGAIWVSAGISSTLTTGLLVQVLGVGTPTWPLYAYGVFGTKPH